MNAQALREELESIEAAQHQMRLALSKMSSRAMAIRAELEKEEAKPKATIIHEIQPEEKTEEVAPAEVSDKLVNDLNDVLGTEVHVLMGIGRTQRGHGGAKAAQTRKINKIAKTYSPEEIKAGLEAVKVSNVHSMFHYANDDRGHAPTAEKNIAHRFGL